MNLRFRRNAFSAPRAIPGGLIAAATVSPVVIALSHLPIALYFSSHNPYEVEVFPECAWHQVTGLQCVGCGGTRSLYSLMHGDLTKSIEMNPVVPVLYIVGGLILAYWVAEFLGKTRAARILQWSFISIATLAALYSGVIRNL